MTDPRGTLVDCQSTADAPFSVLLGYDSFDRLTLAGVQGLRGGEFIERSKAYDRNGNVTSARDGEQAVTQVEYTDLPKLVRAPSANGVETNGLRL